MLCKWSSSAVYCLYSATIQDLFCLVRRPHRCQCWSWAMFAEHVAIDLPTAAPLVMTAKESCQRGGEIEAWITCASPYWAYSLAVLSAALLQTGLLNMSEFVQFKLLMKGRFLSWVPMPTSHLEAASDRQQRSASGNEHLLHSRIQQTSPNVPGFIF